MEDNDLIVKRFLIGEGAFGQVYMANSKTDGRLLAVKSSFCSSLFREEEIIRYLGLCPNIIHCFGGYHSSVQVDGSCAYNLILEYAAGGTLQDLMRRRGGKLPESEVQDCARMMLRGLSHMHQKGVVHCDLKPENVLVFPELDCGNIVKIADFGLSKIDGEEEEPPVNFRGTPAYMSPESLKFKRYDQPMDIWALGCSIIQMVTGKGVWADCQFGVGGIIKHVVFDRQVPKIPECLSESGKDFLAKCLERDPKLRWTAEMLLNHPFLTAAAADDCPRSSGSELGQPVVVSSSDQPSVIRPPADPTTKEENSSIRHLLSNLSLPAGWEENSAR